ncbi:MAG: type II toxin-antitoxin system RelE/ParE family toxin [Fimbriiglobus sp.]|nr:type II toxin-antitoxin system RelE/ParE family toxin [Fimbriiglobus sp.]
MAELTWSEQAVFDIERTLSDIQRTSPAFATMIGDEIQDVSDSLPDMPLLGEMVPDDDHPTSVSGNCEAGT